MRVESPGAEKIGHTASGKRWIQLQSGEAFNPLDPDPSRIYISDIAHALSMLCRYNGHVSQFYSVAEHSVAVLRIVRRRGGTLNEQRWALLHDASEAYLADVPSPVKHAPEMAPYRAAEARLQAVIAERFGLVGEEPDIVRRADYEILAAEAGQLKMPIHPDWVLPPVPPEVDGVLIGGLWPLEAFRAFKDRFIGLFGAWPMPPVRR